MRYEVLMAVKVTMFWVLMLCGLTGRYQLLEKHTASVFRAGIHL
jgi:hypothetical protein